MVLSLLSILTINFSSAQILPLKKPKLSMEDSKKLLVDVLKPPPKPIKKKEIEKKKK